MKKLITITLSLALSIFLLSLAVKGTLAFRQLYFYDIDHLNIARDYGMKKEEIMKNYNILIDYIQNKKIAKLSMPSFKMSKEGEIHFKEVKDIFMKFNISMYFCGVVSILGIIYMTKIKSFLYLKFSSIMLIVIPVVLSIPFAINFDKSFTAFHKLFFTNDYWEFDPVRDPIINVLPQEFFFHCAVMILALVALFSTILYLIYRRTKKINRA
ncbi:TIGR01906 family protein [Clostridiales bacterium oral taxon 876 str. F0540]|nr:TIGR01906 family protein [Clostridiales bacterium oral taxon 876 str. F0540]